MLMTDYTDHASLPHQDNDDKLTRIIVTLWDEHFETALSMNICVGQLLYLKNLNCKVNKSNIIELNMNGYRPGRGFAQVDPISILDTHDPLVAALRRRKARHGITSGEEGPLPQLLATESSTSQQGTMASNTLSGPTVTPNPTAVKPALPVTIAPSSTPLIVQPTKPASSSISTPSDRPVTFKTEPLLPVNLKREVASPPRSRMSSTILPSLPPPLQFSNSCSTTDGPPTRILIEKVRRKIRDKPSGRLPATQIRFLRLNAGVVDFEPSQIKDFSVATCNNCAHEYGPVSDRKIPTKCPRCRRDDSVKFKYKFMLKLMDELYQIYNVHVNNEGAQELLGTELANAPKLRKTGDHLNKLKEKLARIGVVEGHANAAQKPSIYFDCYLELVKIKGSSPVEEPEDHDWRSDDEGNDTKLEGDTNSELFSQPFETMWQKRQMTSDMIRRGKRPCRNVLEGVPNENSVGLVLQGLDNQESQADFQALLVCTTIV
ncbi:hypothetical protein BC939DRAFT_466497 [Gamsiella multidivaricata]|uniref:uncharacterized protein n=1 Tax=Gamsiella multidivaricata TaxID=101098 RepID=UPI00221F2E72|nr:uncharacterized protein BC939DRAFT_466497 [Gamsiella multidivaricata]KAI7817290.1 hypothetical protein BC939DRAFT_466497 [Gamsiella multidivaricata]